MSTGYKRSEPGMGARRIKVRDNHSGFFMSSTDENLSVPGIGGVSLLPPDSLPTPFLPALTENAGCPRRRASGLNVATLVSASTYQLLYACLKPAAFQLRLWGDTVYIEIDVGKSREVY